MSPGSTVGDGKSAPRWLVIAAPIVLAAIAAVLIAGQFWIPAYLGTSVTGLKYEGAHAVTVQWTLSNLGSHSAYYKSCTVELKSPGGEILATRSIGSTKVVAKQKSVSESTVLETTAPSGGSQSRDKASIHCEGATGVG